MTGKFALDSLAVRGGRVFGWGWFLDEQAPAQHVELRVPHSNGGFSRLKCTLGGARQDLAEAYPSISHASSAGFLVEGRLAGAVDDHGAELHVRLTDGRESILRLPGFPDRYSLQTDTPRYLRRKIREGLIQALRGQIASVCGRGWRRIVASLRQRLALWRIRQSLNAGKPLHVVFDHAMGGGANRFREALIADIVEAGGNAILIFPSLPELNYRIRLLAEGDEIEASVPDQDRTLTLLAQARIEAIHINDLVSYDDPLAIVAWAERQHARGGNITLYLHDYHAACPVWTLVDDTGRYCGVPSHERCRQCLSNNDTLFLQYMARLDISHWREQWWQLIRNTELIAFSRSSVEIFRRAYPMLDPNRIMVKPHKLDHLSNQRLRPDLSSPLTVAVVGHINVHKGARVVGEIVELIQKQHLPMEVVVIGTIEGVSPSPILRITGPYDSQSLHQLLARYKVGICLLPSICPETFSYVTAELMALEMPLAVFDLGAPAERVHDYRYGAIISEVSAEAALSTLKSLWEKLSQQPPQISHR